MGTKKTKASKKDNRIGALNIILFAILIVLGLAVCSYTCYQIGYHYGYGVASAEADK